jgi:hypothetical protein
MSFLARVHSALALLTASHSSCSTYSLLLLVPLLLLHQDGQADVVGVLADDLFELPAVEVLGRVVAQVQDDAGAARGAGDGFDLEVAGAAADPAHAFLGFEAGTARLDGDLVGHDEARVKAHAELADQLASFFWSPLSCGS